MDTNELPEAIKQLFGSMADLSLPMLGALDCISQAMHGVHNLDNHSDESYRYMQGKLEAARLAIAEAHAHLSMICTNAPSHGHYIGGTPTHLYRTRNPRDFN